VAAATITLATDEMARLDDALWPEAVSGPRYNERTMKMIDR
jgi:hypothetical protein